MMPEPQEPTSQVLPDLIQGGLVPTIPDHEMIRMIGQGSSGQVWLARNALGTYRAVKIVSQRSFRLRRPFEREMHGILKYEPVSRLHDGLVDILQVGINENAAYFYYVMELADDVLSGPNIHPQSYVPRTLAHDQERLKRLPIAECVRLGAGIASALGFLHRHELVHRDIKPSNIVFVSGTPKLADIGLMTDLSEASAHVGTDGFIPGEGAGTIRADIYSLGKVLYELSTGKDRNEYPALPEDLKHDAEAHDLILLNRIILKACRTKPWQRYQTAEEMMSALLSFQFDKRNLQKSANVQLLGRLAGIGGAIVVLLVLIEVTRRLISMLKGDP
jgi:serine/threonine protein kinase